MLDKLKERLPQIIDITEGVPEAYRATCFQLLLSHLLKTLEGTTVEGSIDKEAPQRQAPPPPPSGGVIPARVRAFLRRHNLTEDQLAAILFREGEETHFVKEPREPANAVTQIQWSLLMALRNALRGGEFEVDPEAVRSLCIDKGCYDPRNFSTTFKRSSKLFRGEMVGQGSAQRLSDSGEEELAELITRLAG